MLAVIFGNLFYQFDAGIVAVGFVNQNFGSQTKPFTDQIERIVVVVQNALNQHQIETVVGIRQMVGVSHFEADGARAFFAVGDFDGLGCGINSRERGGPAFVPKTQGVKTIAASHVQNRAAPKPARIKQQSRRPVGGHAAAQAPVGGVDVSVVGQGIGIERRGIVGRVGIEVGHNKSQFGRSQAPRKRVPLLLI